MPTFADLVMAELNGIKTAGRPNPFVEALVIYLRAFGVVSMMRRAIDERVTERFQSRAYGEYLEGLGFPRFIAKNFASQIISLGTRKADEARHVTKVVEASRFLAKGRRQRRAILSRARVILAASNETSIVDSVFFTAGVNKGEFLSLLQSAVDEGEIDCERIKTIAAAVTPALPPARGRKISAASATHEQLLEMQAFFGTPTGYTWDAIKGEYVDQRTRVTRLEFDAPNFDPRPAHRRVKWRGEAASLSRSRTESRRFPIGGFDRQNDPN